MAMSCVPEAQPSPRDNTHTGWAFSDGLYVKDGTVAKKYAEKIWEAILPMYQPLLTAHDAFLAEKRLSKSESMALNHINDYNRYVLHSNTA